MNVIGKSPPKNGGELPREGLIFPHFAFLGLKTSFFVGFLFCKKVQSPENNPLASHHTYLDYLQGKNPKKKMEKIAGGSNFPPFSLFRAKNVIFGRIFFL